MSEKKKIKMIDDDVTIILVDDDPGHRKLIEKNLRRSGITNKFVKLHDGQHAVDFFLSQGEFTGGSVPEHVLVLLDLNMPVMDGFQVLEFMKSTESTKHIPVIMVSTTDNPAEIRRCYDLGCNSYISKPVEYDEFAEAIRELGLFLSVLRIPGKE